MVVNFKLEQEEEMEITKQLKKNDGGDKINNIDEMELEDSTVFVGDIIETVEININENALDKDSGIIKDIVILSGISRNGRIYPEKVLRESVTLFNNSKVFKNHPSKENPVRVIEDIVGKFVDSYYDESTGKVIGDLQILEGNRPWLYSVAEEMPDIMGMSINATGRIRKTKDNQNVVEKIETVRSVDLVADPATTYGLFEQQTEEKDKGVVEDEMDIKDITLEQLKAENSAVLDEYNKELMDKFKIETLVKEHAEGQLTIETLNGKATVTEEKVAELEGKISESDEKDKSLTDEIDNLKKEVDDYKVKEVIAEKMKKVSEALKEASLPDMAVSDLFKEQLMKAEDEEKMKALIDDRKTLFDTTNADVVKESGKTKDPDDEIKKVEEEEKEKEKEEEVIEQNVSEQVIDGLLGLTEAESE